MIDKIVNLLNNKVVTFIKDDLGRIVYQAIKKYIVSGVFPLTLENTAGSNLTNYKIEGNSIQDGTPTPDNPIEVVSVGNKTSNEFEPYGYKIPVKASAENLYKGILVGGEYIDSNGDAQINTTFGYTDYIEVEPSTNYTLSMNTNFDNLAYRSIATYDQNYNFIKREIVIETNARGYCEGILTTTSETKYVRINILYTLDKNINFSLSPITTNIYLDEPLRKIGEYADYIDFANKKVVRKTGKHVYDENSTFTIQTSSYWFEEGVTTAFYTEIPSDALPNGNGLECLCNLLNYDSTNDGINKKVPYISGNSTSLVIAVNNETASSVEELQTFLSQTNMEVIYPLATETEETIDLPSIPTLEGTTILDSDVTVQPIYVEVEYTNEKPKAGVPFTLANGETLLDSNGDYFNVKGV